MEISSEGTVRNSNGRLRANSGREPREKVTILRKKFSPPMEVAARRDGGIEVYDIGPRLGSVGRNLFAQPSSRQE